MRYVLMLALVGVMGCGEEGGGGEPTCIDEVELLNGELRCVPEAILEPQGICMHVPATSPAVDDYCDPDQFKRDRCGLDSVMVRLVPYKGENRYTPVCSCVPPYEDSTCEGVPRDEDHREKR